MLHTQTRQPSLAQSLILALGRLLFGFLDTQPVVCRPPSHVQQCANRRYAIPPERAHLYARAADAEWA